MPNDEIVVDGITINYNSSYQRPLGWLLKLNPQGDSIWTKTYTYFNNDSTDHYFYAMDLCNDGGFVMAGMTIDLHNTVTTPRNAMWLVKTDCMGNDNVWDSVHCVLPDGVPEISQEIYDVLIYPNPASNEIMLATNQQLKTIHIYNVLGEEVLKLERIATSEKAIDISTWNAGVYFLEAETEKGIVRMKFVKE